MTQSVTLTLPYEDSISLLPVRKDPKNGTGGKDTSSNQTVFFILIILIWYSVSVGHNLLNKRLLEGDLFPFPFTLTLLQLSAITIYSFIYIKYFSNDEKHVITSISEVLSYRRNRTLIIGLSLGKFLTLVFSHLSLTQVPLAFTHTVKGSLPLFVVVLSRLFLRHTHTREVYLSLLPIVVGVSLVSFQSPSRNPHLFLGIVFAFVSTLNLALLNVFSKKLLSTTFSAISLLHLLTKFSLLIFVPFYILIMFTHRPEMISWSYMTPQLPFILLLDGALSFSQNILAFSLLSMCSPLTYSIANCSKRVAIISLSFVVFSVQNLNLQSMTGIAISLIGIFCYNMAKHREKSKKTTNATKKQEFSSSGDTDYDRHSLNSFYNV